MVGRGEHQLEGTATLGFPRRISRSMRSADRELSGLYPRCAPPGGAPYSSISSGAV